MGGRDRAAAALSAAAVFARADGTAADRPARLSAGLLALIFAGSTNGMFMPERIDHHGWQLAMLALSVAAIADPKRVRGG